MNLSALSPYNLIKIDYPQQPNNPGGLLFTMEPAAESPVLGSPSMEVGDIFFVQENRGDEKPHYKGIVSLGPAQKITQETIRRAAASISHWMQKNQQHSAYVDTTCLRKLEMVGAIPAAVEGLHLGAFRFDRHKTDVSGLDHLDFHILVDDKDPLLIREVQFAQAVTAAVNLARDWGHEPANVINPVTLAERIKEITTDTPIRCTVLDEKQLAKIHAGGLLSVGKGSQTPPRLIILEYPGNRWSSEKPAVLVGKALTFDSGGYSIKDATNIQRMKYDKSGGIQVLAIMVAAATLGLDIPLVGVISAAENMISGEAYRPDDIITTLSGKTVEIVTTDAEGRLVLADALTYVQQNYTPRAIIDLATLTGGVIVALGRVRAGIWSNDDALAESLISSGDRTFERLWRLPLDEDYLKIIKGDEADLKNSGGREGHPVFGGVFLKQFVDDQIPWAHIDIAGVADTPKDLPYSPKGATGFGVRLTLDYLMKLGEGAT